MNKLSIIVPVYNDEKNIENAINSLLDQSIQVDIIVVDDGSTDNTSNILNKLKKKYKNIHYYKKRNGGIADARNFGLSKVKTKYFGFLDSDDMCREDMAEKMLDEIEKTKSDICFSNFTWVYPNGNTRLSIDTGYNDKKEIMIKMFAILWNKIYKTSWFKKTKLSFPKGYQYEDASVLYRLVPYMDKVCYVDDEFVEYNQREKSITHTFDGKVNDMIVIFSKMLKEYKNKDNYQDYYDELCYITVRFFLGNSFLRASKIKDKETRNKILEESWEFLNLNFPNYKENPYLNQKGIKNLVWRSLNKNNYYKFAKFINLFLNAR